MTTHRTPIDVAPLVSTQWLADHLGSESLIVVDASVAVSEPRDGEPVLSSGYDQYLFDGHVPGAVFADVVEGPGEDGPWDREAGALGITAEHTVIVYDASDGRFAARLRSVLHAAGIGRVAILDGGLQRWRAEGRDVEDGMADGSFAS
ncbi:hypothetical protein KXS11_02315 [Plantibacter flavus]|uniref:sulfurtransferase n=1 Tax=Plantibacter flavus TaxID=150123 RepID=UPI003F13EF6B